MDRISEEKLNFITNDEKLKSAFREIPKIASADISILISGESGTGKEIIANFIHLMSHRKEKQFVAVNCAAMPIELLESELFGHKKGAFTGAVNDHCGLFEMADGGTIFLDEIGDMPLVLQAKLLRILQNKKIRRVGESREKQVNFRIVSATHKCLRDEVKAGRFREDLFYRLCGCSFHLPALRQRKGDIRPLIYYFSTRSSEKYSIPPPQFSERALEKLERYSWPGNVRQLENIIEQMTIRYQKQVIDELDDVLEENLFADQSLSDVCFCRCKALPTLAELTARYINFVTKTVNDHQGNASKILGISRRTLYRKIMNRHFDPQSSPRELTIETNPPGESKQPTVHH